MAYQARERDPLFERSVSETIEKRGQELIGLVFLGLGALAMAMIASYTPSDPNWMVASDAEVQNWLGSMGASLIAPVFMIIGWASWGIAAVFVVWGLRFVLHFGHKRIFGRVIFAPIAIGLLSIYAASQEPSIDWFKSHSFGYGGLFGDTVMGAFLTLLPLNSSFGIKVISLLMCIGVLIVGGFALGLTRAEVKEFIRGAGVGFVMIYAGFMALLGRGARTAFDRARAYQDRQETKAMQAQGGGQPLSDVQMQAAPQRPVSDDISQLFQQNRLQQPEQTTTERPKSMIKRSEPPLQQMPEPELVEARAEKKSIEMPSQDSIQARISGAILSRRIAERNMTYATQPQLQPQPQMQDNFQAPMHENAPVLDDDDLSAPIDFAEAHSGMTPDFATPPAVETVQMPPVAQPVDIPTYAPKKVVQPDVRKPVQPSKRAIQEAQPSLAFEDKSAAFELPPLNLLENSMDQGRNHLSDEALEENARMLENVLDDYGVKGEIVSVRPGPVVTMYELEPAPGLKASRVVGLADDIARSMSALSARVSTVPGRSVIGIELPNENREKVVLREILSSRDFGDSKLRLPLALGKDIGGEPMVANLAKMPHLLIAGTTGSGKSVAINTMILSLLYKLTPQECRMIMIDPKMLELSVYDGIPHLLSPVVTDPKKAVVALKWAVGEMEDRYRKMSKMGVRNIDGYNARVRESLEKGEMFSRTVQTGFDEETGDPIFETEESVPEVLPYIVVIVDEMADLMMVAGKEIEACIQRLAQMARASGIHLIMATQRPSVDVITGTIKSNFPTRISFQVTSKIDSRTILGEMGAEQLLGMGDMLYMAGGSKVTRCHGPFVSDEEVEEVVNHLKAFGAPEYVSGVVEGPDEDKESNIDAVLGLGGNTDSEDALYDTAVAIVLKDRKCSTSYIQRKLAIGYNKAARLVEQMEEQGVVSAANHVGKREILVPEQN